MATANKSANGSASGNAHGENRPSFEENFTRLQEVVARLSEGNLTLQEALSAFEEGMSLADTCADMLEDAELRVKQVSERAVRAGLASRTDLDAQIADTPASAEQGLVALEIETYESTLFLSDSDPTEQTRPAPPQAASREEKAIMRPTAVPLLNELDPLFDDED